jgi:hypothetical protein
MTAQDQRVREAKACERHVVYGLCDPASGRVVQGVAWLAAFDEERCEACLAAVVAAAEIPVSIVADNFAAGRRLAIAIVGGRAIVSRICAPLRQERRTGEGNAPTVRRIVDALSDNDGVTDLDLDLDDDVRWLVSDEP